MGSRWTARSWLAISGTADSSRDFGHYSIGCGGVLARAFRSLARIGPDQGSLSISLQRSHERARYFVRTLRGTCARCQATKGPIFVLQDTTEFSYQRDQPGLIGAIGKMLYRKQVSGNPPVRTVCGILCIQASLSRLKVCDWGWPPSRSGPAKSSRDVTH
jgi:hypothetical protein